jgi:NADP-dependent 3-hydroxy acid dehydrogenase YdfG/acyl carrier protein
VVTGGLGAIGLHIAGRLVQRGVRHLVLVGRSRPSPPAQQVIARLELAGCKVKTLGLDVGRKTDVSRLFDEIERSGMPRLAGVVHAAGISDTTGLDELSDNRFERVMAPKVWGAWLLDREAKSRDLSLSLFVCVSSTASVWGAPSHAHYSAANAYLDALMSGRKNEGLAGLSVNFGPWQGAGMARDEGAAELHKQLGLRDLDPLPALDALEAIIGSGASRMVVVDVDWGTFKPLIEFHRPRPLLADVESASGKAAAEDSPVPGDTALDRLRVADAPERVRSLTALIGSEVAQVLKVEPASLKGDVSLLELGMDSLMAVELINRLGRALAGSGFTPSLLQGYPSVSQLANAIAGRIAGPDPGYRAGEPSLPPAENGEALYRTKDGSSYTCRRHRAGDKTGAVDSCRKTLGEGTAKNLDSVFDWKYLHNPLTPESGPCVEIVERDGEIVGMNGGTFAQFKLGDMTVLGDWSCDSHVASEHREVTSWFFHRVTENAPPLRLSMPNPTMYRFASATGAVIDLDELIEFRACLDMRALLESRGVGRLLASAGGIVFGPVPKILGLVAKMRAKRGISVAEIPGFDRRFDELWHEIARDYPGIMVRDQTFLSWRFDCCPNQRYRRYIAERNGKLAAYMVTREHRLNGRRRGLIVDFLARRNDKAAVDSLVRRVVEDFVARNVGAVVCPISSSQREHIRVLAWHGLLFRRHRAHVVANRGPLLDSVAAIKNWFFTYADADIDYSDHED